MQRSAEPQRVIFRDQGVEIAYRTTPTDVEFSSHLPAGWSFSVNVDGDADGRWGTEVGRAGKSDQSNDRSFGQDSRNGIFCAQYVLTADEKDPSRHYMSSDCNGYPSGGRVEIGQMDKANSAIVTLKIPYSDLFGTRRDAHLQLCVWDTRRMIVSSAPLDPLSFDAQERLTPIDRGCLAVGGRSKSGCLLSQVGGPSKARTMNAPSPKPWVMAIAPYTPGRSTTDDGRKVTKLSSNENPLGTSPAARAAFEAEARELERYPDAGATLLREALAEAHGLDPARIIYGTGSDEILHLVAGAFAGPGDEVIHVRYGFAVYEIATRRVGAQPVVVPDRDYATDVDAILAAVTERTRMVYLANPNNPTGTFSPRTEIARLHAGLPAHVLLVLDQAYAEYLAPEDDDGGLALAESQPNVLVTRTFSKIHGLAAERIGWGYGALPLIDAMHRIRAPFNVTIAGQQAAVAALRDTEFVAATRAHNDKWRAWLAAEIAALGNAGLRVVPSQANFLLVLFEGSLTAEAAYKGLMDAGYIVRWIPKQGLPHALRITVGTEDETRGVAGALRQLVRHSA